MKIAQERKSLNWVDPTRLATFAGNFFLDNPKNFHNLFSQFAPRNKQSFFASICTVRRFFLTTHDTFFVCNYLRFWHDWWLFACLFCLFVAPRLIVAFSFFFSFFHPIWGNVKAQRKPRLLLRTTKTQLLVGSNCLSISSISYWLTSPTILLGARRSFSNFVRVFIQGRIR